MDWPTHMHTPDLELNKLIDQVIDRRAIGVDVYLYVSDDRWFAFQTKTGDALSERFPSVAMAARWFDVFVTGWTHGNHAGRRGVAAVTLVCTGNAWFVFVNRKRLDHQRLPAFSADAALEVALDVCGSGINLTIERRQLTATVTPLTASL